jgi:pilus assembly protein CpaC
MIVNTSRIIQMDRNIVQLQINNPDLLVHTFLSPKQVQLWAKKAGVTQVNLFDEKQQIFTVDVVVTGDARELTSLLEEQFPNASIRVRTLSSGVLVSGHVDRPQDVDRIKQIAEEYYPKVIANITVAGVQQVLLHVKVYEVSRTKLRSLGFDWSHISNGGFVVSGVSQLLSGATAGVAGGLGANAGNATFSFKIVDGGSSFLGVLEALRRDDLIKVHAEPTLTTISGRPAYFHVGGEIPYQVSQGFGAIQVDWKPYGTEVDFVPIVLGNGRIRLEVRPRVREFDDTRSSIQGIPAFKINEVDTGVELEAGQTLAIAGLVQRRIEAQRRALPVVGDIPYLGTMFSMKREEANEIEYLVLVTPQLADAMDPQEVPPCGPGTRTTSPSDWELYMKGFVEVPNPCPPCTGTPCAHSRVPGQVDPQTGLPIPSGMEPQADVPVVVPPSVPPPPPSGAGSSASRSAAYTARSAGSANRYNPPKTQPRATPSGASTSPAPLPGFRGAIGYDPAD